MGIVAWEMRKYATTLVNPTRHVHSVLSYLNADHNMGLNRLTSAQQNILSVEDQRTVVQQYVYEAYLVGPASPEKLHSASEHWNKSNNVVAYACTVHDICKFFKDTYSTTTFKVETK